MNFLGLFIAAKHKIVPQMLFLAQGTIPAAAVDPAIDRERSMPLSATTPRVDRGGTLTILAPKYNTALLYTKYSTAEMENFVWAPNGTNLSVEKNGVQQVLYLLYFVQAL